MDAAAPGLPAAPPATVALPVLRGGGEPTFAVAFGGGGARGLAHVHAIAALNELGIVPVAIAGSSIGAIMGAGMASGMDGEQIGAYARGILGTPVEVLARLWRSRPGSLGEMMTGRLGQLNVERIVTSFMPPGVPARFAELKIPLKVVATDYYGCRQKVIEEGDLFAALAASAALPALFRPVLRDGCLLIDGGVCNPVPFDLLEGLADIVVAVDVLGGPVPNGNKTPNSIELMIGASQLMMRTIMDGKLRNKAPHVLLRPPVSRFRVLDFLKVEEVIAETAGLKDELKRAVEAAVEARLAG